MSLAAITALYREFGQTWKNKKYEDDNDPILDALLPYVSPYYHYSIYGRPLNREGTSFGQGEDEPDTDFL
jgi:hypothetical protein